MVAKARKRVANESQNQIQFDTYYSKGGVVLGPYTSHIWRHDPRHLGFLLARYKFCAKMLVGKKSVLEIGCGDSVGTAVLLQSVESVHGLDIEPLVIEDNKSRLEYGNRCTFEVLDITQRPVSRKFDAAISLDVIEHIPTVLEGRFLANVAASLGQDAVFIIGTPNITANAYASEGSRLGHINLKSGDTLRRLMSKYFHNVFLFSMNDEVVHTGFSPMAHYLLAMGVGLRDEEGKNGRNR